MDVPEQERPRRRRPVQVIPSEPEAPREPPRRIIIAQDEEPEWMVSAKKVSGAASRRNKQAEETRSFHHAELSPAAENPPPKEKPTQKKEEPSVRAKTVRKPTASKKTTARKKPRKLSKKARARRAQNIRRGITGILAAAVVLTLVVVGCIGGSRLLDIKRTLDRGDGVFYPNIFVNDIPLEGKTLDEAAAVVTQQVTSLISSWKITLRTQDGRSWDITGEDLKMKYDVADQLDQLWAIGHTGTSAQRYEQVKALEEEAVQRYTTLSYDLSAVNQILAQIKSEVDQPPVSATKVYDNTKFPPYSYTDDVPGQELDITGLNEKIMGMVDRLESGVVDLSPTPVEAPVTREYLESQIVVLSTLSLIHI